MKYIFYSFFLFCFIPAKGQKIESGLVIANDTSSTRVRIVCAPTEIKGYPLVIIDGKKFDGSYLQNLFFNVNDIESIRVIGPKQDSIKYFGKRAQYGIIILNMKHAVVWTTSKEIRRQKFPGFFRSDRKILFEVDGQEFAPNEKLYFADGFIKNIIVNNHTKGYYADKLYEKKIIIKTVNPKSS